MPRGGGRRRKMCQKHHRDKYNMSSRTDSQHDRLKKKLKGLPCEICGWNEAPCDLHRIVPGKLGGTYRTDNIIVLCPNCHRMRHFSKNG